MSERHEVIPLVRNLVDVLLNEIERVVAMRERWRMVANEAPAASATAQAILPGIDSMTIAIEAAKAAIGGDDVVASLRAHHTLKAFTHG